LGRSHVGEQTEKIWLFDRRDLDLRASVAGLSGAGWAHSHVVPDRGANQRLFTRWERTILEEDRLVNVSPAHVQVSGDWMGPNADGTPNTWHFVGESQAMSTTAFDGGSLAVTAAASFEYEINTTAEFVDPSSGSIFTPGGAANYDGFFELDSAATYTIVVQLNRRGRVRLSSFEGLVVFDRINISPTPMFVNLTGTIPPGHYEILATTSLGAPNFPNGVNHFEADGSFENMVFTVQIPEPTYLGILIAIVVGTVGQRGQRRAW
jgi:hypothetical protein